MDPSLEVCTLNAKALSWHSLTSKLNLYVWDSVDYRGNCPLWKSATGQGRMTHEPVLV